MVASFLSRGCRRPAGSKRWRTLRQERLLRRWREQLRTSRGATPSAISCVSVMSRRSRTSVSENCFAANAQGDPVTHPLPDLGATDLGRGRVLHEVIDRCRADARQPRDDVANADVDVGAKAGWRHAVLGVLDARADPQPQPALRSAGGSTGSRCRPARGRTRSAPPARGRGGRPTCRQSRLPPRAAYRL